MKKNTIKHLLGFILVLICTFCVSAIMLEAESNETKNLIDIEDQAQEIVLDKGVSGDVGLATTTDAVRIIIDELDEAVAITEDVNLFKLSVDSGRSYKVTFKISSSVEAISRESASLLVYYEEGKTKEELLSGCYSQSLSLSASKTVDELLVSAGEDVQSDCYFVVFGDISDVLLSVEATPTASDLVEAGKYLDISNLGNNVFSISSYENNGVLLKLKLDAYESKIISLDKSAAFSIYDENSIDDGISTQIATSILDNYEHLIYNSTDETLTAYIWVTNVVLPLRLTTKAVEEFEPKLTRLEGLDSLTKEFHVKNKLVSSEKNYVEGYFAGYSIKGYGYKLVDNEYNLTINYRGEGQENINAFAYILNPAENSVEVECLSTLEESTISVEASANEPVYLIICPSVVETEADFLVSQEGFLSEADAFDVSSAAPINVYYFGTNERTGKKYVSRFLEKYPELSPKVTYQFVYTKNIDVAKKLSDIKASKKQGIIIYEAEHSADVRNYLIPVSQVGIKADMIHSFEFEKLRGSWSNQIVALAPTTNPGFFIYRTDVASSALGIKNPTDMQKRISNWNSFLITAETLRNKGYYITTGTNELNKRAIGLSSGIDYRSELISGGYDDGNPANSEAAYMALSKNAFGTFGDANTLRILRDKNNDWSICQGPIGLYYNNKYMGPIYGTKGNSLAGLFLYTCALEPQELYSRSMEEGILPNDKQVVATMLEKGKSCLSANGYPATTEYSPIIVARDAVNRLGNFAGPYSITYKLNGGVNNSNNPVSYNLYHGRVNLYSPTKKGYIFQGWYTEKSFKNKISYINSSREQGITVYAKWKAIRYNVKFRSGKGCTGRMSVLTARAYNKKYRLPRNRFRKKGYTFVGWSTKSGGKVVYKNRAYYKNLTAKDGKTVVLYARWKKNKR